MGRILGSDFDAITEPFSGDEPYGSNVQYGERYESIQHEIQKLTAASSAETTVDWKAVRKLAIELLSEESKDLSIACFLAVALFLEDGYGGARDGLDVVRAFVNEEHWEGIFPPAKRAVRRANDLRWLVERLGPLVEDRPPKQEELEHLQPMLEAATAIGEQSRALLKEMAPGFGELIGGLRTHVQRQPAPPTTEETPTSEEPDSSAEEEAPATDSGQQPAESPSQPASSPTPPTSSPPRPQPRPERPAPPPSSPLAVAEGASALELRSHMETLVKPLRDADILNPVPYRILRSLKWEGVPGPATTGKTRIPGPRPTDLNSVRALLDAGNWSGLLDRSENLFKGGCIWLLDLQRLSALALENLDPRGSESPAAEAIKQATREVVQRVPTLVDCTFADDLPFASDETRSWLLEISTSEGVRIGSPRAGGDVEGTLGLQTADIERAVQLLRKKRLTEGMEVLQRGVESAAGPRSRFRARLDAATACLNANQAAWARPMLESLRREAGALTFDAWEPVWAVELYQLLAICYGRLAKSSKGDERRNFSAQLTEIKDILCRLDMQAAAAVEDAI